MRNKLVSLSGYSPALTLPEEGLLPYEQLSGDVIEEMSALGWSNPVKRVTQAVQNVVQTGVDAARQAAQAVQAQAVQAVQQAKATAISKVTTYIEEQKAKALSSAQELKDKYPIATIERAKEATKTMLKNPQVQDMLIMTACSAIGQPDLGPKMITAKNMALKIQAGEPLDQVVAAYGPEAQAYIASPEGQAFSAFLRAPSVETLQSQMNNLAPAQIQLAQAFLEEAQRNIGADVQKLFENAFSIFDYVSEGKLY